MGIFTDFIEEYFGTNNEALIDSKSRARPVVMTSNQTGGIVSQATGLLYYRRNRYATDRPPLPLLEGDLTVRFSGGGLDGVQEQRRLSLTANRGMALPPPFTVQEGVGITVDYVAPDFGFSVFSALAAFNGTLYASGDRVGGGDPEASYLISLGDPIDVPN
jgi:hypothetical protein